MTLETPPPNAGLAVPTAFMACMGFCMVPQPPLENPPSIGPFSIIGGAGGSMDFSRMTPAPPVKPPLFIAPIISIGI